MNLRWIPEIYMLPSSRVVLIAVILEPTLKPWSPYLTGNEWIIVVSWGHLEWSLWGPIHGEPGSVALNERMESC